MIYDIYIQSVAFIKSHTDILAALGASSWIPLIFSNLRDRFFLKPKLMGKIINRDYNLTKPAGSPDNNMLLLFKLSLLLENKQISLKNIECIINFEDGTTAKSYAVNNRYIQFIIRDIPCKLKIPIRGHERIRVCHKFCAQV
jgi:hypothetical protein